MRISCRTTFSVFIVLTFISLQSIAQDSIIRLGGIVTDQDNNPLPFAHVYINDSVGTVTSDSGLFVLKIPSSGFKKLMASQIGYINDTISISAQEKKGFVTIRLLPSPNVLQEVVVLSKRMSVDSATFILKKALQQIRRNYPTKKYSMKGFYRETSILDTTYSRLLEGYFLISDNGYHKDLDNVKIEKLHFRKTEDKRDLNWRSSLSEWLYGDNGLYKLLSFDRMRLKSERNHRMEDNENKETHEAAAGKSYRFLSPEFIENTDLFWME